MVVIRLWKTPLPVPPPFWAVCPCLFLAACASSGPQVSSAPYTGPALSVDSSGMQHRVVLAAPTSGWSLAFDRSQKLFDRTEVYITITRPNPAYATNPVLVNLNLNTAVDVREDVAIFARVLNYKINTGPYDRAAASAPKRTPVQPN